MPITPCAPLRNFQERLGSRKNKYDYIIGVKYRDVSIKMNLYNANNY